MDAINHVKATLGLEDLIVDSDLENILKIFEESKINENELMKDIYLLTQQQLNKIK